MIEWHGVAGTYDAKCGCSWETGLWTVCDAHQKPHREHVAPTSFRNCCEETLIAAPNRHEAGFETVCACGNIIRATVWQNGWETFTADPAPGRAEGSIPFVHDPEP